MLRVLVDHGDFIRTQVFDASGRLVLDIPEVRAASVGEQSIKIDTAVLAAGVYLISVRSDEFRTARRLVITR